MTGFNLEGKLLERAWKPVFLVRRWSHFSFSRGGLKKVNMKYKSCNLPFLCYHCLNIHRGVRETRGISSTRFRFGSKIHISYVCQCLLPHHISNSQDNYHSPLTEDKVQYWPNYRAHEWLWHQFSRYRWPGNVHFSGMPARENCLKIKLVI
jgi:hypothetical protein